MTKPMTVHGVDISHHQAGNLDMAGAKKRGLRWLYHKATEGDSFTDSRYQERRQQAHKAGIPFGAYHFARPERSDAEAEARRFLSIAKPVPGNLRPCLDLETDEGLTLSQLRTWADTWCDVVAKAVGVQPVIYTPFDLGLAQKDRIIWRPRYNNDNNPPVLPWDIWQFSNGVFGVPNTLAGFGNVDLNVMAKGTVLNDLVIPLPKPDTKHVRLHVMHTSLQFSDTDKQHTIDIEAIFARADKRNVAWITGTEAGPGAGNMSDELVRVGDALGYRMWVPSAQKKGRPGWATDCWIGVRKDLIAGGWEKGYDPVIPGSSELLDGGNAPGARRWGPKGLVHVGFDTEELGRLNVSAAHYLTGARQPGETHGGINHWEWNEKLGLYVGTWAKEVGKGSALAFYGGDQNMADNRNDQAQGDTFFGAPMTSVWDEVKKWENTGHGNIDVVASYDPDGRVAGSYIRALDDKEFFLHTDHFLVEAGFDVRTIAA